MNGIARTEKGILFVLEVRMRLMQNLRLKNNLKVEFLRFSIYKYTIKIQTNFLPCWASQKDSKFSGRLYSRSSVIKIIAGRIL